MKTFNRICLKDETITDGDRSQTLYRGKEYITSEAKDGAITVFTSPYWVHGVDVELFGGEVPSFEGAAPIISAN